MSSLVPPVVKKTLTGDYGYTHAQVPSLKGKVVVVTGGTNGIGLSYARTMYTHGATLFVLGHQEKVGGQAIDFIKTGELDKAPLDYAEGFKGGFTDYSGNVEEGQQANLKPGSVEFIECNFESMREVAQVAQSLKKKLNRLDIFAGLAGKGTNATYLTPEGIDSHLALNNLSHHVLLSHLLPILQKTAEESPKNDVRIINMSSELHRATFGGPGVPFGGKFRNADELKQELGPDNAYARTKLCAILFTQALVQRFFTPPSPSPPHQPILVFATHPGAVATGQQKQFKGAYGDTIGGTLAAVVRPAMRKPDEGSLSALWSSTSPAAREKCSLRGVHDKGEWDNGAYFTDPEELGMESSESHDQELIDNFWTQSQLVLKEIVGEGLGDFKH